MAIFKEQVEKLFSNVRLWGYEEGLSQDHPETGYTVRFFLQSADNPYAEFPIISMKQFDELRKLLGAQEVFVKGFLRDAAGDDDDPCDEFYYSVMILSPLRIMS